MLVNYLDRHRREDKQIGKIESERRQQKPQLIPLRGRRRPPGMEISKRRHRNGAADADRREIRRKHLALQVPELMPRKIPRIGKKTKKKRLVGGRGNWKIGKGGSGKDG